MATNQLLVIIMALLFNVDFIAAQSPQQEAIKTDPHLAPGRMVAQGRNVTPVGNERLLTYRLEEVDLQNPLDLEFRGTRHHLEKVLRLTITSESIGGGHTIWIDDAALPQVFGLGKHAIGVFIYDRSILRDGAEISVFDGKCTVTLPERLRLPQEFDANVEGNDEKGNRIIGITTGVRVIGSQLQPVIQIEMKTSRAFQVRNAALQLQIGRKFFMYELGGESTGHTLTLSLSPELFAQLKDGSDVVAFYNIPDRTGAGGRDVWYFGRLNKNMLVK
jgi:hypothetical protein